MNDTVLVESLTVLSKASLLESKLLTPNLGITFKTPSRFGLVVTVKTASSGSLRGCKVLPSLNVDPERFSAEIRSPVSGSNISSPFKELNSPLSPPENGVPFPPRNAG